MRGIGGFAVAQDDLGGCPSPLLYKVWQTGGLAGGEDAGGSHEVLGGGRVGYNGEGACQVTPRRVMRDGFTCHPL